jgi:large subunit ribosomal protein L15
MNITDVTRQAGRNRRRKRVGRGRGSGRGKTCTRGQKGCGARAGGGTRPLTEGGQMALFRRLPKRGFSNARFRAVYSIVNVADLELRFDAGAHVTAHTLQEKGLLRDVLAPVKILGDGELTKPLIVQAHKFSKQAAEKITKAGGQAKVLK